MNIGQIIKAKIIECDNSRREEIRSALNNGYVVFVDYEFDGMVCGYDKKMSIEMLGSIEVLIEDVIKNNYKYEIKKDA